MTETRVTIPKEIYVEVNGKSFAIEGEFSFPVGRYLLSEDLKEIVSTIEAKVITLSIGVNRNE